MALKPIASVTRQFGSFGTPGLFVAHKRDNPDGPESRVGFFKSPPEAQRAVEGTMGGQMLRWKREDIEGDIESYVGYLDL
jgi:hypothetical protein